MKQKMLIGGGLLLVVCILCFVFVSSMKRQTYAYVDQLQVENGIIRFRVFGAGNAQYGGYDLIEEKDGIYRFTLYGKSFFGDYYPIIIKIDNKDEHIKKIIQQDIESQEDEIIFELNRK